MAKSAKQRVSNAGVPRTGDRKLVLLPLTIKAVQLTRRRRDQELEWPVLKVTYRYADASNYKFWGELYVIGELTLEELRPHLIDAEFFIPERIDLPSLVPPVKNEDDHLLHTFEEVTRADGMPYEMAAEELLGRIRLANQEGWFAGIS